MGSLFGTSVGNIPVGLLLKNGKEPTVENVMELINSGEIENYQTIIAYKKP